MSREERQSLLHDGTSSSATLSAYVEIVFANPDGRFPTGKSQVTLRRTIGLKKDEYSLDNKSVSKGDVVNLLESAGFSRSNPYYIVPQGRIASLTNAKDSERLQLLKEVAGTRVYEQKRTESLKIMQDTNNKRDKVIETLNNLQQRLSELDHEKEELRQFQDKDRERRCIEYSLYQQELDSVTSAIDKLRKDYESDLHDNNRLSSNHIQRSLDLQSLESNINQLKQSQSQFLIDKDQLNEELSELYKVRTKLELEIEDTKDASENSQTRKQNLINDLNNANELINQRQIEYDELLPNWQSKINEESDLKRKLDNLSVHLTALYSKQSRSSQFNSKQERDQYLNSEINSFESAIKNNRKLLYNIDQDINKVNDNKKNCERNNENFNTILNEKYDEIENLKKNLINVRLNKNKLIENRKEVWREDSKLDQTINFENEQKSRAEFMFNRNIDKDTSNGLKAVENLTKKLNLNGVHGPLYSLFEVPESFKTCAEVTANNSLFHVVVDNDLIASQLLNVMIKEKLGRITFMPLNRLKRRQFEYPDGDDAIPLINKLNFNEDLEVAFNNVFGRTIVCPDLHIASRYARSHGLNAITLDGDLTERRGTISGGYHDKTKSKLDSVRQLMDWNNKVNRSVEKSKNLKNSLLSLDQEILKLTSDYNKFEIQLSKLKSNHEPILNQIQNYDELKVKLDKSLRQFNLQKAEVESEIEEMNIKIEIYKDEMKQDIQEKLSDEEIESMKVRSEEQIELKERLSNVTAQTTELESQKELIEIEINENLKRSKNMIEFRLKNLNESDDNDNINDNDNENDKESELNVVNSNIEKLSNNLMNAEQEINNADEEIESLKKSMEDIQQEQEMEMKSINKQSKSVERFHIKIKTLNSRRDEFERNIRDLGVLPEEAFTKYTNISSERMLKQLSKVRKQLSNFSHVNKKAVEQYTTFTEQRDELIKRRDEQDEGAQSIQDLILHLDQRKDEAIERTFKQVSKYFSEIFEKLVPSGKGRLIMQKRIENEDEDEESSDDDQNKSSTDNYTGVSIKVKFMTFERLMFY